MNHKLQTVIILFGILIGLILSVIALKNPQIILIIGYILTTAIAIFGIALVIAAIGVLNRKNRRK